MSDSKILFNEFPPVSTEIWESAIACDLNGADYEKKLVWNIEGFKVRPYYRAEDLKNLQFIGSLPGEYPYSRGNKKNNNNWEIRQDIIVDDVETSNRKAIEALQKGATAIGFVVNGKIAALLGQNNNFALLLKNLDITTFQINFITGKYSLSIIKLLDEYLRTNNIEPSKINGSIDFDPIGHLTTNGNFYSIVHSGFSGAAELVEFGKKHLPNLRIIAVNGQNFQNAGSTIVQELSFSLAIANEYLVKFVEHSVPVDTATCRMQLNLSVGSNYFLEIAKIRAARLLWAKITEAYHPKSKESAKIYIHIATSGWSKTIYDPYVNMLRTTTEAMSASLGGADSITVHPFDNSYATSGPFSERIARNTQIILKEEAHFDKIADPAGGSYYIENLTNSLAANAWELFKLVEDKGGYLEAFETGFIQQEIEASAKKKLADLESRRQVLLGTNQHPNANETIKKQIDTNIAFPAFEVPSDAIAKPLRPFRGAEEFEKLRLETENNSKGRPKVFLFTIGKPSMRKARAGFAINFFAVAGFEIIDNPGFSSVDEGVKACHAAKPQIIVICSSDEEYPAFAPEIVEKISGKAIIVVAGNPVDSIEQLKSCGINHFIHVKTNILESLKEFQKELLKQ